MTSVGTTLSKRCANSSMAWAVMTWPSLMMPRLRQTAAYAAFATGATLRRSETWALDLRRENQNVLHMAASCTCVRGVLEATTWEVRAGPSPQPQKGVGIAVLVVIVRGGSHGHRRDSRDKRRGAGVRQWRSVKARRADGRADLLKVWRRDKLKSLLGGRAHRGRRVSRGQ